MLGWLPNLGLAGSGTSVSTARRSGFHIGFYKFSPVGDADPTPVSEGFRIYGLPRVPGVKNTWKPMARWMDPQKVGR